MNKGLVYIGIAIMLLASLVLIFVPEVSTRAIIGISMLFVVGFGLTVAGSPDPKV